MVFHGLKEVYSLAYLVASVLCVMSLGGLASQTTARLGNAWGQIGAFIGITGTAQGSAYAFHMNWS